MNLHLAQHPPYFLSQFTVLGLLPVNATFLPKPLVTCQEGNGDLDTKAIATM